MLHALLESIPPEHRETARLRITAHGDYASAFSNIVFERPETDAEMDDRRPSKDQQENTMTTEAPTGNDNEGPLAELAKLIGEAGPQKTRDILDRVFKEGPVAKPTEEPTPGAQPVVDALAPFKDILEMIAGNRIAPSIGVHAAEGIVQCFERAADEIEAIAQKNLDRAEETRRHAGIFATSIRRAGAQLAEDVERTSLNCMNIAVLMHHAGTKILPDATPIIREVTPSETTQRAS